MAEERKEATNLCPSLRLAPVPLAKTKGMRLGGWEAGSAEVWGWGQGRAHTCSASPSLTPSRSFSTDTLIHTPRAQNPSGDFAVASQRLGANKPSSLKGNLCKPLQPPVKRSVGTYLPSANWKFPLACVQESVSVFWVSWLEAEVQTGVWGPCWEKRQDSTEG